MFGFDENVCGKCGARRDDIGLGGCFCRDEERTMSEQKSFPTPAEYLALRKERVEREDREKAEAEQKRLADLDAKALVYAEKFLQTIRDGGDPWDRKTEAMVACGIDHATGEAIVRALARLGWPSEKINGCVHTGPGGFGKTEETYYNEKECRVVVPNPALA